MRKISATAKITAFCCSVLMFCTAAGCSSENSGKESQPQTTQTTEAAPETTEASTTAVTTTAALTTEAVTEPTTEPFDLTALSTFELSSEDLHDGVWNSDITKTQNGSNRSPQLSWIPVEGAVSYVIYMIDTSADNWMHWKSVTTETTLPAGWAPKKEYIGLYPPGGTHDYEVYVLALRESVDKVEGRFDSWNLSMDECFAALDKDGGNVISYGHIKGTYTKGD